jgi:AraC-like DNA-binding protein
MDRHDVPGELTPEDVIGIHQRDLEVQDEYNCRAITYWYDGERNKAFCLFEAPDRKSILSMHEHSHGQIPHHVIEVDENLMELFYGKIENPEQKLTDDPGARTMVVIRIEEDSLIHAGSKLFNDTLEAHYDSIAAAIDGFEGSMIKKRLGYFLASFRSVSKAISCCLKVQSEFNVFNKNQDEPLLDLKIGVNTGVPVTEKETLFESTISLADRICTVAKEQITISAETKDLYKSESLKATVDSSLIASLDPSDENFVDSLMDYLDKHWSNPKISLDDFSQEVGYSKSQLYRKLMSVTGKSSNVLIKEFRLNKALQMLKKKEANVSEACFASGFSSPSYFSKCFLERYGVLPSDYIGQIEG